jgi:hypothetical protein
MKWKNEEYYGRGPAQIFRATTPPEEPRLECSLQIYSILPGLKTQYTLILDTARQRFFLRNLIRISAYSDTGRETKRLCL